MIFNEKLELLRQVRSQAGAWERACTKSFALSKIMRSRYQIINNSGVYFITSTVIEWIPVFTKREYFDIIVRSLSYCRQNKGLKLFAYVVMDNLFILLFHLISYLK